MRGQASVFFLVAIGLAHASEGATIRVPDEQPTIRAGVDASASGDTVVVRCGTYFEHNINILRSITLVSESGDAECVTIDAQELGHVATMGQIYSHLPRCLPTVSSWAIWEEG
jgi:nitrous oxidase accessory protein NosD